MIRSSTITADHGSMLERLYVARATVAALVAEDEIYVPIFVRLESEIAAEEARGDPVARARAIAQRAMV